MLFLPCRDKRGLISTFDTYQEHYTTKQTLVMFMRKKYEKYNDILEDTIDDINANEENLDGIFDDFENKDLERHTGKTSDSDEYTFYDLDNLKNIGIIILK